MQVSEYYKPCKELDLCNELIEKYYNNKMYKECFDGHITLARQGYPLAECQVGFFYWAGLGVEINKERAFYWTKKSAEHGDRDAQYNLGKFFEEGYYVDINLDKAMEWYKKAADQNHDMANQRINKDK